MAVPHLGEAPVGLQPVRDHHGPWLHDVLDEWQQAPRGGVGHTTHANASDSPSTHLRGDHYEGLLANVSPTATGFDPANEGLVHLDDPR